VKSQAATHAYRNSFGLCVRYRKLISETMRLASVTLRRYKRKHHTCILFSLSSSAALQLKNYFEKILNLPAKPQKFWRPLFCPSVFFNLLLWSAWPPTAIVCMATDCYGPHDFNLPRTVPRIGRTATTLELIVRSRKCSIVPCAPSL